MNSVETIKESFIGMHSCHPNSSLEEEQECIYTAGLWCAWPWHPHAACWALLALERVTFMTGAGSVCTKVCPCHCTARTVQRHSLEMTGLLGFDLTRQLTPADAPKVECRLPAEIHSWQKSPLLPFLVTVKMKMVRNGEAAETCLALSPATVEGLET